MKEKGGGELTSEEVEENAGKAAVEGQKIERGLEEEAKQGKGFVKETEELQDDNREKDEESVPEIMFSGVT